VRYLLFGGLALLAVRNTSWFGFVAAPSLAAALSRWTINRTAASNLKAPDRLTVNRVLAAGLTTAAVLSLPWLRPYMPLPGWRAYVSPDTPVQSDILPADAAPAPPCLPQRRLRQLHDMDQPRDPGLY